MKQNSGKWYIIFGVVSLLISIVLIYEYFNFQYETVLAEQENVWNALGNVFAFAALGSELLAAAGIMFVLGWILILIGVIKLRR